MRGREAVGIFVEPIMKGLMQRERESHRDVCGYNCLDLKSRSDGDDKMESLENHYTS